MSAKGTEAAPEPDTEPVPAERPGHDVPQLIGISAAPLDVAAVHDVVQRPAAGAIALFVGVVRDSDGGKAVTGLGYTAHPTAETVLRSVVHEVTAGEDLEAVAAVHRTGDLTIGDIAIIVAVACGHRGQAFDVCERLVDAIKARVPIWKHQLFADGTDEWVGTP